MIIKRITTVLQEESLSKANRLKLLLTIVSLSLIVGILLGRYEVINYFIWGSFADGDIIRESGHFSPGELNMPGYVFWLYLLPEVTGLQLKHVAVVPLGVIVVPLTYYIVIRSLFGSFAIALLAMVYNLSHLSQTGWYNTFAYAWARPLFLLCLFGIFALLSRGRSRRFQGLVFALYTALLTLHYTPPGWLILFIGALLVLHRLNLFGKMQQLSFHPILLILMGVLFFFISRVFYAAFVPALGQMLLEDSYLSPIFSIVHTFQQMIGSSADTPSDFAYRGDSGVSYYSLLRVVLNLVIILPVGIAGAILSWRFLRDRGQPDYTVQDGLILALLIVMGVHATVYGIVFSFSTQFIIFFGPVIGLLALDRFAPREHMVSIYIGSIAAIGVVTLIIRMQMYETHLLRYSLIAPAGEWLAVYSPTDEPRILASIHQLIIYDSISQSFGSQWIHFSDTIYHTLVTHDATIVDTTDYLVADPQSQTEYTTGERISDQYQPLGEFDHATDGNSHLNRVYDDGRTHTYHVQSDNT